MNFAAQLFYSSYLSERLERLYSPRPAIKDTEENDPFWQRWEFTTCSSLEPPDLSPHQLIAQPIVTDPPSVQSSEIPSVTPIPFPHSPSLQPTLTNTPSNLQSLPVPLPPQPKQKRNSTQPPTCLPNPSLAAAIPKLRSSELPSNDLSPQMVLSKPSPAPSRSPAEKSSVSSSISQYYSSPSSALAPCREEQYPTFQALVDLLLRLVLYLILLFDPR